MLSVSGNSGERSWLGQFCARNGLLLAVIAIAILPLALRGPSCGQDFDFHLQNWLEANRSWHQGVIYPRWVASANYGAGEPRFIFYPPAVWMLGAAIGSILPWTWTPLAFALLAWIGAGWGFRLMAREWLPDGAAMEAACLYVVNPYLLFVAYERGALAEQLAAAWIPLLVLCGLRRKPSVIPLALVIAVLWLTNAPAATMGCYTLAALVVLAAIQERSWALVRRALAAVPLGLGLAAVWLVPAVWEQRWVEIGRVIGPLMRVEDSFFFGHAKVSGLHPTSAQIFATDYHNDVLHTASWIVAALLMATAAAALLSYRKRNALWMPLVVLGAAVALLQFPFSDWIWRWAPELKYLQFPWRWMLVLAMILAALAGMAVQARPRGSNVQPGPNFRVRARIRRSMPIAGILLLASGLALLASNWFWQPCDEEDNVRAQMATFRDGGFFGTDEYTPQRANNNDSQQGVPPVRVLVNPEAEQAPEGGNPDWSATESAEIPAQVKIERWDAEHMTAVVTSDHPGYAVLRLMNYPAWRVTRNNVEIAGGFARVDGLMVVPVGAGASRIDVRWVATDDVLVGEVISLIALAITLGVVLEVARKARPVPVP